MDWSIFWSAFGAIGTTAGSLITAIAVVIAVKQYKQPIEKRISVTHGTSFPVMSNNTLGDTQIYIEAKNLGIRDVSLSGFYLKNRKTKFLLNGLQSNVNPIDLSHTLKPEESISFMISYDKFVIEMKRLNESGKLKNQEKLKVCVQDTLGVMHYDRKKLKLKRGKIN